jgi:4-hydroxy-3-methylbut-2-enyl diphosphate reductase
MGVRRAMDMVLREAERQASSGGGRTYTLGPLIHNTAALAMLEERGVRVLDEETMPDRLDGDVVVIRAHGVPVDLVSRIEERGGRIVDATCPRVSASQKKAARYSSRDTFLFLAGEADHGEIVGIASYARGHAVVSSPEEASRIARDLLQRRPRQRVALIGQTTIKRTEFDQISAAIQEVFSDLEVFDSICAATDDRQRALRELAEQVEAIVVVGGKNSANTKRLYRSALEAGLPAWHVEDAAELPPEVFSYDSVGLTAGASTPESVVDAVERRLSGVSS